MRAAIATTVVGGLALLASCRTSGIKGTIIVREHCGTRIGTPSLLIEPTHFLSNTTVHRSTSATDSGHKHGGNPQDTAGAVPGSSENASHKIPSMTRPSLMSRHTYAPSLTGISMRNSRTTSKSNSPPISSVIRSFTGVVPSALSSSSASPAPQTSLLISKTSNPIAQSPCVMATATPISCPASNGTLYTAPGSCIGGKDSYIINCGTEYSGEGLSTLAGVTDIETCIDTCTDDASCMAVAFDTTSQMCYQRSSVVFGNSTTSPGLIFAYNARYVDGGMYSGTATGTNPTRFSATSSSAATESSLPGGVTNAAFQSSTSQSTPPSLSPSNAITPQFGPSIVSMASNSPNGQSSATSPDLEQFGSSSLTLEQSNAPSLSASQQGSPTSASATITEPPSPIPTTPVSQACPRDANQNIMVPEGTSWTVNCAQVYVGQLIDTGSNSTSSNSADDCLATCDDLRSQCVGFTYTDDSCMLYSRIDGYQDAAANIVSARRYLQGRVSSLSDVSGTVSSPSIPNIVSSGSSTFGPASNSMSALASSVTHGFSGTSSDLPSGSTVTPFGSSTLNTGLNTTPTPQAVSSSNTSLATTTIALTSTATKPLGSSAPAASSPCSSADGTTYTDRSGNQYMIMCSTDTHPGNFASLIGVSFETCIEDCALQTEQSCVAVTYTNETCFYKAQFEDAFPSENVEAAVLLNLATGTRSTALAASTSLMVGAVSSITAPTMASSTGSTNPNISSGISAATNGISSSDTRPLGSSTKPGNTILSTSSLSTGTVASSSLLSTVPSSGATLSSQLLSTSQSISTNTGLTSIGSASNSISVSGGSTGSGLSISRLSITSGLGVSTAIGSSLSASSGLNILSQSSSVVSGTNTQVSNGLATSSTSGSSFVLISSILSPANSFSVSVTTTRFTHGDTISSLGSSVRNTASNDLSTPAVSTTSFIDSSAASTVSVPQGSYTVLSEFYTGTSSITGPVTISTVFPSGTNPGTYIVAYPARYVQSNQTYTGSSSISGPITISTVLPSGTNPGTYIVAAPASYFESTTDATTSGSSAISSSLRITSDTNSSPTLSAVTGSVSVSSSLSVSSSTGVLSSTSVQSAPTSGSNIASSIASSLATVTSVVTSSNNLTPGASTYSTSDTLSNSLASGSPSTPVSTPISSPMSLLTSLSTSLSSIYSSSSSSSHSSNTNDISTSRSASGIISGLATSSISTSTVLTSLTGGVSDSISSTLTPSTTDGGSGSFSNSQSSTPLSDTSSQGHTNLPSSLVSTSSLTMDTSASTSVVSSSVASSLSNSASGAASDSGSNGMSSTGAFVLGSSSMTQGGGGSPTTATYVTTSWSTTQISSTSTSNGLTSANTNHTMSSSSSLGTSLTSLVENSSSTTISSIAVSSNAISSSFQSFSNSLSTISVPSSARSSSLSLSSSSSGGISTTSGSALVTPTITSTSSTTVLSSSSALSTLTGSTTRLSSTSSIHTTCAPVPTIPSCPGGNQTVFQALDGSQFRLDCGIDYPVFTVDAYAAASLQTCFQICGARGPTCLGVVYVPGYLSLTVPGYTCFFKSAISAGAAVHQTYETDALVRVSVSSNLASGVAPLCPSAAGLIYVGADGSRFRIDCNKDYPNNGLIQANASSFQVCVDACDSAGILCAGVSYTPAGNQASSQPTCYLKSLIGIGVNAILGGVLGTESFDVHSAVRIGLPTFINPPAISCVSG